MPHLTDSNRSNKAVSIAVNGSLRGGEGPKKSQKNGNFSLTRFSWKLIFHFNVTPKLKEEPLIKLFKGPKGLNNFSNFSLPGPPLPRGSRSKTQKCQNFFLYSPKFCLLYSFDSAKPGLSHDHTILVYT